MGFFNDLFSKIKGKIKGENKFNTLTREDVNSAIMDLYRQEEELEQALDDNEAKVKELMEKGRTETSHQKKLLYAKKIQYLQEESKSLCQRIMYLLYNTSLLQKLKVAVDENKFFLSSMNCSLNAMLTDQKSLSEFLYGVLATKNTAQEGLQTADEFFKTYEQEHELPEAIYGIGANEEEILAGFEAHQAIDETDAGATATQEKKQSSEAQ